MLTKGLLSRKPLQLLCLLPHLNLGVPLLGLSHCIVHLERKRPPKDLATKNKDFSHLFFMAVHFNEGADLSQVDGLPIPESHNLVKCKDEAEAIVQNVSLIHVPESLSKNSFTGIVNADLQYSGMTLLKSLRVSRSSKMLLA